MQGSDDRRPGHLATAHACSQVAHPETQLLDGRTMLVNRLVGFLLACLLATTAFAAPDEARFATIKQQLESAFPAAKVEKVQDSPLPGLYEVVASGEVVYTNADASLLFTGRIVEVSTKQDLTARRLNQLRSIDFKSLPFDRAIKLVKGDGSRQLALFADPFCPYCMELEQELARIENTTVFLFLYPLESIHPGATEQSRKIWCAKDRGNAWSAWMLSRTAPEGSPSETCEGDPTESLQALGQELKITATPTMFFEDGHRVSGSLSQDELEKEFAASVSKP